MAMSYEWVQTILNHLKSKEKRKTPEELQRLTESKRMLLEQSGVTKETFRSEQFALSKIGSELDAETYKNLEYYIRRDPVLTSRVIDDLKSTGIPVNQNNIIARLSQTEEKEFECTNPDCDIGEAEVSVDVSNPICPRCGSRLKRVR